jgi:hypothetical protein
MRAPASLTRAPFNGKLITPTVLTVESLDNYIPSNSIPTAYTHIALREKCARKKRKEKKEFYPHGVSSVIIHPLLIIAFLEVRPPFAAIAKAKSADILEVLAAFHVARI